MPLFCAIRLSSNRIRLLNLFLTFLMLVCCSDAAFSQGKTGVDDLESQVKAAYLYNFTKFVYWNRPESDNKKDTITIALLEADSICDLLEVFSKKGGSDHSIVIRRISGKRLDIQNCHLLFIGQAGLAKWPAIEKLLEGTDTLTVSDIPGFARQGGMIGLFLSKNQIGIEINMDKVQKAGLKISAKLLEIAKIL